MLRVRVGVSLGAVLLFGAASCGSNATNHDAGRDGATDGSPDRGDATPIEAMDAGADAANATDVMDALNATDVMDAPAGTGDANDANDANASDANDAGDAGAPCAVGHGGCDPLVTCASVSSTVTCGACPTGYTGTGATSCTDINECLTANGGCDLLATCTNTAGSHTCGACPAGYTGTGATSCTDINECLTANGGCDALTTCTNTAGSHTCSACPAGYSGSGATACTDIDECLTANGGCDALTTCTNTVGSHTCGACPAGYVGSGATSCVLYRTSCYQYLQLGPSTGDGLYTIDPDGAGPNAPVQVYCDMTNGGWTQILDQDIAVSNGYLPSATWRAGVATTAPNAGQWSILNRVSELANTDLTFELRMTYGTDQAEFIQWVQTGDPSTGTRGTLSDMVETPSNQSGCGAFAGLGNDGQGESAWDGDVGGCWWFAVGSSGAFGSGIPAVNGSDGGQIVTNRVRLYVRAR